MLSGMKTEIRTFCESLSITNAIHSKRARFTFLSRKIESRVCRKCPSRQLQKANPTYLCTTGAVPTPPIMLAVFPPNDPFFRNELRTSNSTNCRICLLQFVRAIRPITCSFCVEKVLLTKKKILVTVWNKNWKTQTLKI